MSAAETISTKVKENEVMVFSKSHCPFCRKAIQILQEAFGQGTVTVLQMESRADCGDLQDELLKVTGGRTVPRVFIKGKFVGGCDEVVDL
mmetsp:Transcript_7692/g.18428  ORF Transcript_7692/g.18428 Transcript_7692/m.18428 type:complete len:90 (+) Transcript_7692:383-652(+)